MKWSTFTVSMVSLGAFAAFAGACASVPPPTARVASSEAAVRGARDLGAEKEPTAAMHLKLAQDELGRGRSLMAKGDNEEAAWTLARAEADAELSSSLAREAQRRRDADLAAAQVRQFEDEHGAPAP